MTTPTDRTDALEAVELLTKYASVSRDADTWPLAVRIQQIARTFQLVGRDTEADAIITAYNALHRFVVIRCRATRDAEDRFSIPNHYPAGHKVRVGYEARVTAERATLATFPLARDRILSRLRATLSGVVLDETLAAISREAITAPAAAPAVNLRDGVMA